MGWHGEGGAWCHTHTREGKRWQPIAQTDAALHAPRHQKVVDTPRRTLYGAKNKNLDKGTQPPRGGGAARSPGREQPLAHNGSLHRAHTKPFRSASGMALSCRTWLPTSGGGTPEDSPESRPTNAARLVHHLKDTGYLTQ
jgi:hypothetical protein